MATKKPVERSKNVGKADVQQLEAEGRLKHVEGRGFDAEPNPTVTTRGKPSNRGHVMGEDGMRKGLTPAKYHAMVEKEAYLRSRGSQEDVAPNLESAEYKIYQDWLKKQPKKVEKTVEDES